MSLYLQDFLSDEDDGDESSSVAATGDDDDDSENLTGLSEGMRRSGFVRNETHSELCPRAAVAQWWTLASASSGVS